MNTVGNVIAGWDSCGTEKLEGKVRKQRPPLMIQPPINILYVNNLPLEAKDADVLNRGKKFCGVVVSVWNAGGIFKVTCKVDEVA